MKIAIYGYGNLGRGVEAAVAGSSDAELFGIFTRRPPQQVNAAEGTNVFPAADILKYKNDIDVLIICGGSATDLPEMTPRLAADFNVVDSFDTHAKINAHYEAVDKSAAESGHTALISAGWDPGLFSLNRLYAESILPDGQSYTFWGRGVSQGHSDAIRRIDGVADARQYTVPVKDALDAVRKGGQPQLTARQKHTRECYVVAKEGADRSRIEHEIVSMPDYFADYDTTVTFISAGEMKEKHSSLPHGGCVIRSGKTFSGYTHTIEYSLTLESNPEFTSSVLLAFARAVYRLNLKGDCGCKTVFDIPPALLSPQSPEEIRKHLL